MRSLALFLLVAALALPATVQAAWFHWVTEAGTVAYTDDADQIPARYRASAKRVTPKGLYSYPRLTVVKTDAAHARTGTGIGTAAEAPVAVRYPQAYVERYPSLELAIGGDDQISLPLGSSERLSVQRNQWRYVEREGLGYYKPFTVIEQNGRTVAEIEPR
jgi:hypothetical protein